MIARWLTKSYYFFTNYFICIQLFYQVSKIRLVSLGLGQVYVRLVLVFAQIISAAFSFQVMLAYVMPLRLGQIILGEPKFIQVYLGQVELFVLLGLVRLGKAGTDDIENLDQVTYFLYMKTLKFISLLQKK